MPAEAERAEQRADDVDPPPADRAPRRHGGEDQQQRRDHQRHVQREDPPPRELVDDPAAGERPEIAAIPPQAVHDPIAAPRSFGPKAATMIASEHGVTQRRRGALERPRRDQHADRRRGRAGTEKTPKPATPSAKTRRSPKMSPSEPPIRISEPSVSR